MINLTKLWTGAAQPADGLRYGSGTSAQGSADSRKPITVWNITRTCNLRCVHCYSDSNAERYLGELTWDQMETVVADLGSYKVPSLLLSGGEPMIHPRFFDLVDTASQAGLKLTISTNGTLITEEKAALLKAANVAYVGISLDGIGKIHDEFRRKEGAFDAAVRGFKNCHAVDQKTGLRLTLTRHNVENIDRILDFIEEKEIQRVCFYHLVPAGRGSELQVLSAHEARKAIDTLIARVEVWHRQGIDRELLTVTQPADGAYLLLRMEREQHPNLAEARRLLEWNGGGAHSSGRGIANIDTQGNVHPDQFWQGVTLGNVKQMPFSEIWEGANPESAPMLAAIRSIGKLSTAERQARLSGPCADCRWFDICGGGFRTRAAFANKGDLWGSDPGCYLHEEERRNALAVA
ncbi:MAG: radical SAM protein [Verrucomicrobiales bacterium]|jgi:radical SAM protein with 4Fe4S-binding SPASM domain|nr:radical SAM protein [Verrucomicrobiales bacterium]MBP9223312.1 radical SAM protein [Verrucomicrobiales bacterium]HQZ28990.1 radical SAM protein [Verrucomicrobiales bacterium]